MRISSRISFLRISLSLSDNENIILIKSDVCIKLKYIRIYLDIYQHKSCHAESKKKKKKKEEINISAMKTHQISKKWQDLASIKV